MFILYSINLKNNFKPHAFIYDDIKSNKIISGGIIDNKPTLLIYDIINQSKNN